MARVRSLACALMFCVVAAPAQAAVILDTDYEWTGVESAAAGRLFRDGVTSTWANPKSQANPVGGSFLYTTFKVPVGEANFLRITLSTLFEGAGAGIYNTMIGGYHGTFNPTDLTENWLGDPGLSSGNPPETRSFEIIAAPNSTVVLFLHQTNGGTGFAGDISHIRVDAFLDANESEPSTVPEPTSLLLVGSGLIAAVTRARRVAKPQDRRL